MIFFVFLLQLQRKDKELIFNMVGYIVANILNTNIEIYPQNQSFCDVR